MKRLYSKKLSLAIVGLSIAIMAITAITEAFYVDNIDEYFLTVNNEQLHFIAKPDAGYVLEIEGHLLFLFFGVAVSQSITIQNFKEDYYV